MDKVRQIIGRALWLLQQGHTRYAFARNSKGKQVFASDQRATKWCALGAIYAASNALDGMYSDEVTAKMLVARELNPLPTSLPGDTLVRVNDSPWFGKWRVRRAMRRALKALTKGVQ